MKWLIGIFSLAAMSAPAQSEELWQNLATGMSESQVATAQPDAVANVKPSTLHDGSTCKLHIVDFDLLGDPYEVCFYFGRNGLQQVTLTNQSDPFKADFDSVVTALTAKYGPPVSSRPSVLGYEADWLLKSGTNISVIFLNKYGNLLNINYQVRLASEASKL